MSERALIADSIRKSFGTREVLRAASVAVPFGSVVGLLGRMGEGKSTLLRICAGLISADSGWIEFLGIREPRPRLHRLAKRGLYYVPEKAGLASDLSLREQLAAIEAQYNVGPSNEIIALLGLEKLLDSRPHELSGGEERRAMIALAAARRPACTLADEPFRGVDPLCAELIGKALRHLASTGCGILITGHEISLLRPYIDSVTWVTAGTTYSFTSIQAAWENERFRRLYVGQ